MTRLSFIVCAAALAVPAAASAQRYTPILMLDSTFTASTGSLTTDIEDADVEVTPGADGQIHVRIYAGAESESDAKDYYARQHYTVARAGGGVRISDHPEHTHFWSNGGGASLKIEVTVPAHVDLDVTTSDGDITIGDVTGRIAITSADGDLKLGRLAGSDIRLKSSDGDIEAESLEAPSVDVRTSDGDVTLHSVTGALRAESSDGDVAVTLATPNDVSVSSEDGDVTVVIPRDAGFDVDLSGDDVNLDDLKIQVTGRMSEEHMSGTIGGGGHHLTVHTSDGDVTLRGR